MNTRRTKLALGIAMAFSIPTSTFAEGFYVAGMLGISEQVTDSQPYGNNIAVDADFPGKFDAGDGSVGAIGIGYKLSEQLRVEGRIAYRDSSFNDRKLGTGERDGAEYILNGDFESTTLTVEGYYDLPNESLFTPYVKAGLGVSNNSYSARLGGAGVAEFDSFDGTADGYYDNYTDGDSTEFSWNVGLGGNVELSERISIFGEYQYAAFGEASTEQDSFTDGFEIDEVTAHEVMLGLRINL